jgi:hypothetical protein
VPGWAVPLQPPGVGPSGRLAGADLEDCCLAAWEAGPSITPLLQGEAVGGVGERGGLLGRGVTLGSARHVPYACVGEISPCLQSTGLCRCPVQLQASRAPCSPPPAGMMTALGHTVTPVLLLLQVFLAWMSPSC